MADPAADPPPNPAADPAAQPASGQYFEAEPAVAALPRTIAVNVGEMQLTFATDSGVFSPDRLDAGTRLLLREAPPLGAGERRVLDLGCGWGPIACVAGLRSPAAEVLAVDVNERALSLTVGNAERNRAGNVTVARPDEVDPAHRFDRILCNPPIRIGKHALHGLLATWLDRLAAGGRAHLVVHRHLGSDSLARWLAERGHEVDRLVSRSGYRVLEVRPVGAPAT
ncbi:MAG: methyltransferase [Acidimicrobiaceae bacterium]|nr:methyltransferase [Acidimicrobiaceae bacterium]